MEHLRRPNKNLVSVCGLFCQACGIYYSTKEKNEENLRRIATRMNVSFEEIPCNGCRSETRTAYCKNCYMRECASGKGIDFCGECIDFPCQQIKDFQSKMPHRVELFKSLERIKEIGWERWYMEMVDHYSCPECNHLNGWYDINCRKCGNTPGSEFAKIHSSILSR